jgi:hypothetical protein
MHVVQFIFPSLQFAPQNLSHWGLGDRFDEHIAAWTFEIGELRTG